VALQAGYIKWSKTAADNDGARKRHNVESGGVKKKGKEKPVDRGKSLLKIGSNWGIIGVVKRSRFSYISMGGSSLKGSGGKGRMD